MLNKILCHESANLRKALLVIENNAKGVCFIINEKKRLLGILTDGDIRRALLKNIFKKLIANKLL